MSPALWRPGQSSLPDTLAHPPICRVAGDDAAIAPGSVPRELKICWSTNAVCTVGVAVADSEVLRQTQSQGRKINYSGATDRC
jgi:hypothetical protein